MGICSKNLLEACVVMLAPFSFGAIILYPSPAGQQIRTLHGLSDTDIKWSFYNSVTSLFAIVGPFLSRFLLQCFKGKRKMVVFVLDVLGTIFWLLNCLTKVHIWAGIVVRAFLGVVMGGFSSIGPMFLVEIAPEGTSGFFGSLNQIGVVIGQMVFSFVGPSLNYMELNYFGAAVTLLQAILIWFIRESPACGREDNDDKKEEVKESLFQKQYAPGIMIGISLMFFQQFSGINGILTNLADIMNNAGLKLDGNYQAGISTLSQFISVFSGGLIMDKIGRRAAYTASSAIAAAALLIFALNEKFAWSSVLPMICVFIYQLGFGLGLGPIPWFIIPEYFNDAVRPAATMLCTISNWVFAFVVILAFPEMKSSMGMFGVMLFFFAVMMASVFFGIFGVREPEANNEISDSIEDSESSSSERPDSL